MCLHEVPGVTDVHALKGHSFLGLLYEKPFTNLIISWTTAWVPWYFVWNILWTRKFKTIRVFWIVSKFATPN